MTSVAALDLLAVQLELTDALRAGKGYIDLPGLVELKLAAGRPRDESDIVELIRVNPDQVDALRNHLARL